MKQGTTLRILALGAALILAACTHDNNNSTSTSSPGASGSSGSSSSSSSSGGASSSSSGSSSGGSGSSSSGSSSGSSSSSSSSSSGSGSSSGAAAPAPAVTPVGTSTGTVVQASIGSGGGTLTSSDGRLSLSIPAGALASNTTIGIETITNNTPGGLGGAFRLTPNGQTFTQPVTLTYKADVHELDGTDPSQVGLAFQDAAGSWQVVPGVTVASQFNTFTATTTHFTDYGFYARALISASFLMLTSDAYSITVLEFQTVPDPSNPGSPGVVAVSTYFTDSKPQWFVNGVAQPAAAGQYGNIQDPAIDNTTYFTPAVAPTTNNPVALSANITFKDGTKLTLVRNAHVLAHQFHAIVGYASSRTCETDGSNIGPVIGYSLTTSASFDISFTASADHKGISIATSNISPEVDPPTVQNVKSCTTVNPPCYYGVTYRSDLTHGAGITSINLDFNINSGKFDALLSGGWSDVPAYDFNGNCSVPNSGTEQEVREPLDAIPFYHFDGFEGESLDFPNTVPVGHGSSSNDFTFKLTVTKQ